MGYPPEFPRKVLDLVESRRSVAESMFGLFKNEAVASGSPFGTGPLRTLADAAAITMYYVDWYNPQRLHSLLTMPHPKSSSRPTTLTKPAHRPVPPPTRRRHESRDGS